VDLHCVLPLSRLCDREHSFVVLSTLTCRLCTGTLISCANLLHVPSRAGYVTVHANVLCLAPSRAGYVIVNAMLRLAPSRAGLSVARCIKRFAAARPPGIYKDAYIEDMFR